MEEENFDEIRDQEANEVNSKNEQEKTPKNKKVKKEKRKLTKEEKKERRRKIGKIFGVVFLVLLFSGCTIGGYVLYDKLYVARQDIQESSSIYDYNSIQLRPNKTNEFLLNSDLVINDFSYLDEQDSYIRFCLEFRVPSSVAYDKVEIVREMRDLMKYQEFSLAKNEGYDFLQIGDFYYLTKNGKMAIVKKEEVYDLSIKLLDRTALKRDERLLNERYAGSGKTVDLYYGYEAIDVSKVEKATFKEINKHFLYKKADETVSITYKNIDNYNDRKVNYEYGEDITKKIPLPAKINGKVFKEWNTRIDGTGSTIYYEEFGINYLKNVTTELTLYPIYHNIISSEVIDGAGRVEIEKDTFKDNESVEVKIFPAPHYVIKTFLVNYINKTELVESKADYLVYTISNMNVGVEILVAFELEEYNVDVVQNINCVVRVSSKVEHGKDLIIEIVPDNNNYIPNKFLVNGEDKLEDLVGNKYTVKDVHDHIEISAICVFSYSVEIQNGLQGVLKTDKDYYAENSKVKFIVESLDEGFKVDKILAYKEENGSLYEKIDGTNSLSYEMTKPIISNLQVVVTFIKKEMTIMYAPNNAFGNIVGDVSVTYGENATFNIYIIKEGVELIDISVYDSDKPLLTENILYSIPANKDASNTYEIKNVKMNTYIKPNYKKSNYTVTVESCIGGLVEAPSSVEHEGNLIFQVYPFDGYRLKNVIVKNLSEEGLEPIIITKEPFIVENITYDLSIEGVFEKIYSIEVVKVDKEQGSVSVDKNKVAEGEEFTLTYAGKGYFYAVEIRLFEDNTREPKIIPLSNEAGMQKIIAGADNIRIVVVFAKTYLAQVVNDSNLGNIHISGKDRYKKGEDVKLTVNTVISHEIGRLKIVDANAIGVFYYIELESGLKEVVVPNISKDILIYAEYRKRNLDINAVKPENGNVSVVGNIKKLEFGKDVSFVFSAVEHYDFLFQNIVIKNLDRDGEVVNIYDLNYNFKNEEKLLIIYGLEFNIEVSFNPVKHNYQISRGKVDGGLLGLNPSAEIPAFDTLRITARASKNYDLDKVIVRKNNEQGEILRQFLPNEFNASSSVDFENVTCDVFIQVYFTMKSYSVIIEKNIGADIGADRDKIWLGDSVIITLKRKPAYSFVDLKIYALINGLEADLDERTLSYDYSPTEDKHMYTVSNIAYDLKVVATMKRIVVSVEAEFEQEKGSVVFRDTVFHSDDYSFTVSSIYPYCIKDVRVYDSVDGQLIEIEKLDFTNIEYDEFVGNVPAINVDNNLKIVVEYKLVLINVEKYEPKGEEMFIRLNARDEQSADIEYGSSIVVDVSTGNSIDLTGRLKVVKQNTGEEIPQDNIVLNMATFTPKYASFTILNVTEPLRVTAETKASRFEITLDYNEKQGAVQLESDIVTFDGTVKVTVRPEEAYQIKTITVLKDKEELKIIQGQKGLFVYSYTPVKSKLNLKIEFEAKEIEVTLGNINRDRVNIVSYKDKGLYNEDFTIEFHAEVGFGILGYEIIENDVAVESTRIEERAGGEKYKSYFLTIKQVHFDFTINIQSQYVYEIFVNSSLQKDKNVDFKDVENNDILAGSVVYNGYFVFVNDNYEFEINTFEFTDVSRQEKTGLYYQTELSFNMGGVEMPKDNIQITKKVNDVYLNSNYKIKLFNITGKIEITLNIVKPEYYNFQLNSKDVFKEIVYFLDEAQAQLGYIAIDKFYLPKNRVYAFSMITVNANYKFDFEITMGGKRLLEVNDYDLKFNAEMATTKITIKNVTNDVCVNIKNAIMEAF